MYFFFVKNLPLAAGSITSPYGWPSDGVVSLKNVVMRYQESKPRNLFNFVLLICYSLIANYLDIEKKTKKNLKKIMKKIC